MKNKNILITGGLGFIGSHITDELVENNNVTIIDNKSTGSVNNLKDSSHENLEIIIEDLHSADLDKILFEKDYVFHLAAMASVPLSVDNPVLCNQVNVDSTVKLLKAAINNNVKKIVFSNMNMPLKESEPLMPTSPYAASKASCELYLKSFYDSYGLNYTILRYFNVFGPRQDKNSQYAAVIPNFISALLENEPVEIYGDGEQTRDFVYVKDIVAANIKACESDYNGILNVASGRRISINELYEIIKSTLKSDLEPNYLPPRAGDIKHSLADVSNMDRIGLEIDSKNFSKNLQETTNWFRTIL